ncbi:MAG TPA: hypothetical protein VES67_14875 [Vicinamibacterales bacterium]|nr:hypothetical protein [Vicinamibacterales bacterium]
MHVFLAALAAASISAQTAQTTPQPPQQPATTVVGAEGRLVSLIFLRADAENVTRRVYDALLDRQPNEQEFADSVAELQRGRLPQQLSTIVQNAEFTDRAATLSAAQMLDQVFEGMLNRRPTPAEAKAYLPQIQARQYSPALLKLVTSESFRKQVAQDRAAAPERPPASPASAAGRPTSAAPPSMPSPAPATSAPPATTVPMPPAASPVTPSPSSLPAARPPLRPAPFPTARAATVSTPLVAPPALSAEWTRILACQDQVVSQFRTEPPRKVLIRFAAAEISASSVRGTAVDAFETNRRLSYQCTGGRATAGYLDSRPQRTARPDADFSLEEVEVRACHAAVTVALTADRRDADATFETAGVMPTDASLFIRGAGADRARPGQPQAFTYQCQWDGNSILGATFTFVSR